MLASLRKRASIDRATEHLNNDTPLGSQGFAADDSQLSGFGVEIPTGKNLDYEHDAQKQTIDNQN